MIQRACKSGDVAATLPMEQKCDNCKVDPEPKRRDGRDIKGKGRERDRDRDREERKEEKRKEEKRRR